MPECWTANPCVSALLLLFLLREKNEEDEGVFEALGALDACEGALASPVVVPLFFSFFSACFAERKPKAPREAIVAVGVARLL